MDTLTMWLGLMSIGGSMVGWLTSIYSNRHRKRASDDRAKK
jgi:hypothetical protein